MKQIFTASVILISLGLGACHQGDARPGADAQENTAGSAGGRNAATPVQAGDPYYRSAEQAVARRAAERDTGRARNVILFVGDGMGVSTVTAGRIYAGQKRGLDGESYQLAMERMPHLALTKTYSHDAQVSDSAATATAMVTGVKTNARTLGLTSQAGFGNCASAAGNATLSLFEIAEAEGLSTGIVSTARITHATPASAYGESASRNWEDDTAFEGRDSACRDISRQLVEWPAGDGFEIALGGGRRHFLSAETPDPENPEKTGRREDGRDLTSAWAAKSEQHKLVFGREAFDSIDFDSDVRVLGLFQPSHMRYEIDRQGDALGEPSLQEMTRAAIRRLSRDRDGYLLMIEGGRIDHAHHATNAARALEDLDAFDKAVAAALDMTDPADTLVLVTADHSHTMTLAGYPPRGNPILGKVTYPTGALARAGDGKPYTTIGYANGPGAPCAPKADPAEPCTRPDLSDIDTTDPDYRQQATIPMTSETHAGEDVPVFASGPGAELVSGVIEQNEIFHIMGIASGLVAVPASDASGKPKDETEAARP